MDYQPPRHLEDADAVLTAFARWQRMGGRGRGRCGSAEGRYRSTDVHHGAPVPLAVIPDWSAEQVQRALVACPEAERTLLAAWYANHHAKLRNLRRQAGWSGDQLFWRLTMALEAFDANYRQQRAAA